MHWIDPEYLPETRGEVERFLLNPHGDLDGLVFIDSTLIHFPPHLSEAVIKSIRPGDKVKVRGVRPRGAELIAAVSLTAADGTVILDEGPGDKKAHHKKHLKGHKDKHPPKGNSLNASGTVRLSLFGPKGELRGALLEDGTAVRLPPHEAEHFAKLLQPGALIEVSGEGVETEHGRTIETHELARAKRSITTSAKPSELQAR